MKRQIKKVLKWRGLLFYLVIVDLKIAYKNKILGFLWSILDPLIMMIVYVILIQIIFKRGEPQFFALLFSSLLAWHWFIYSTNKAARAIVAKRGLIQTINFPRIILPIQHVITGLAKYLISLLALFPIFFIFGIHPGVQILWLPGIIFIQFIFTLGLAILVSIVGVYLRDLPNILQFGLRIWFYLSPVLFSVDHRIPLHFRFLYFLINPFASIFNAYKNVMVRNLPPSHFLWTWLLLGIFILFSSLSVFDKREPKLAKDIV